MNRDPKTHRAAPLPAPPGGVTPHNVVSQSLSAVVRAFKSASTKRINALRGTPGAPLWQRSFYEHVLRSEAGLNTARAYIENNPARGSEDRENPAR